MNDFLQGAQFLFNTGWQFLTAFNLPGVNFTPLAALFFASFVAVVWKFIRSVVGRFVGGAHHSRGGVSSPPPTK